MKYLLMIYRDEAEVTSMPEPMQAQGTAAYVAYGEALAKAGAMLGGNRLRPASVTTTVRIRDGKTQVLDGPYADTKEQLGGYFLIDVPDLDAALNWAARCPGATYGTMEVRPIWEL